VPTLQLKHETFHYEFDDRASGAAPDAPVLVLSHSLGATLDLWAGQHAAFSPHMRVLRYDARGHGGSVVSAGAYTLAQLGQDVLNLLDALGLERVHFCGLSLGGLTGQWLALNAPQRLQRLVIANSGARLGSAQAWQERARQVRATGMAEVAETGPTRWFTPAFLAAAPQQVAARVAEMGRTAPQGYAGGCEALADTDLRASLGAIAVPTLVVTGRHDPVATPADGRLLQQHIAGAHGVELEASHLSNIEAPEAFNAAVLAFLQS
jgi:3-oxoadipate enol-lactonase